MSILGARLGLAALESLPGDGRLSARFFHQTCALDGIQMATQCTAGNGNLQVRPQGQHRLVLNREGRAQGVEASLTAEALDRGRAFGSLREEAAALPSGSAERSAVEERMDGLLRALEAAPAATLVRLAEVGGPED